MITVSYNAYCAISKEGDNDIWTVRPRGVVPLLTLALCSQIDVGATVNALLGDTFSRENNTHGSRFHDRDPQFASRILGAMTQSCYIGTRDIRSRVIRGPYCMFLHLMYHYLTLMYCKNVEILWRMKRTSPFYVVNIMAADDLATPGARASAAMILTKFAQNILLRSLEQLGQKIAKTLTLNVRGPS